MTLKTAVVLICLTAGLGLAQDDARRVVPATAGRRMALVIGNKSYAWKPLTNPENDARAVAAALGEAGFGSREVRLVVDARRDEMRRVVREFVEAVKPGDVAFVYYSGHGVEVKGSNYLLPVDLPADATEGYVQDEAVAAQRILRDLTDQGARVRVLILDACRDNPLRAARSASGGLAPMEGRGALIVFATESGRTASDAPGARNSVFTKHLVDGLRARGVSLDDAMKRVAKNVARETGEKQVPAIYGLLLEDLVLVAGAGRNEPAAPAALPTAVILPPTNPAAGPTHGQTKVNPKDGLTYVWIPPGEFMMGCSNGDSECDSDESPAHAVRITKGYWLGQTEVTQAAYSRVTGKNPSAFKGAEKPVEMVNWDEAASYCRAVGMRLPTEAEWEYAAGAGTTVARAGEIDRIAWYDKNSGKATHPVKSKEPNRWGLYDILGNVGEWTADWYGTYSATSVSDPLGPSFGKYRTQRGGSRGSSARIVRVSNRFWFVPGYRNLNFGLRCAGE